MTSTIHGADIVAMRIAGDDIKLRLKEKALTINYDDYGPVYAPVVIFIHGFPFNKEMWNLQTEELKSNYRVITYDIRGYGESTANTSDYSLDVLTSDLLALMNGLAIKKAALCGLSIGGLIALRAVEKYPDRFSALVLSDTHCGPDNEERKAEKLRIITTIKTRGISNFAEQAIRQYFASSSLLRNRSEIKAARKMILSTPVSSICNTLLTLEQEKEICSHLSKIHIPVLIMVGKEDEVTPQKDAEFLQRSIPGSSLKVIRYAGHLPNLENSHEFNAQLKWFIDKHCSRRKLSEPLIAHK